MLEVLPPEWLKLLLLTSITIGLWLTLNLYFYRTGNTQANRLLMLFVISQLLPPMNVYTLLTFDGFDWCWILTTNLTWLYGPFLLAFIQSLRNKYFSTKQYLLHASPFIISLLYRLFNSSFADGGIQAQNERDIQTIYIVFVPLFIQVFSYLSFCLWLVISKKEQIVRSVHAHKTSSYFWLLYLIAGLFILMLIDVTLISQLLWFEPITSNAWYSLVAFIAIYLQGIALFALCRPKVFYNDCLMVCENIIVQATGNAKKYRELDKGIAEQLSEQLTALMDKEKPYLINDLSLESLAEMLKVNRHQLSELLNVHLDARFYDYINQYRIQQSIEFLKDKNFNRSILEIAFEAGFNNKNSFYRLFKERTGITPTQFRKQTLTKNS
ncbi:MAG: AraC family transcriptional regulator [Colwellia sp.]|nr:AraC family transcriptional regulator [Colwellia sp.]